MPKQILKIDQFHGGLNTDSDPRDIVDNELSAATDVMVDQIGRITMMGGTSTSHVAYSPSASGTITSGYGLFQFSHDRTGGSLKTSHEGTHTGGDSDTVLIDSAAAFTAELVGGTVHNLTDGSTGTVASRDSAIQITVDDLLGGTSNAFTDSLNDIYVISWPETGDDYLAFADTSSGDAGADLDIYSKDDDTWGGSVVELGDIGGVKPAFYYIDGALRVSDGNFGANETMWYGYIHRRFFGDGTSGYDGTGYNNGRLVTKWHTDEAALKALPMKSFQGALSGSPVIPDDTSPVNIDFDGGNNEFHQSLVSGNAIKASTTSLFCYVNFTAGGDGAGKFQLVAATASSQSLIAGFDTFCSPGDKIVIRQSAENDGIYTVNTVTADSTNPNVITVDETIVDSGSSSDDDNIVMTNLSRSLWFDNENQEWEVAMSTLYDDAKQESALSKFELTGTHDPGNDSPTVMTDAGSNAFVADSLIGFILKNVTDGSQGMITANGTDTLTVDVLTGGSDNTWDDNDVWSLSAFSPYQIATGAANHYDSMRVNMSVFAGDGTSTGLSQVNERVSGFKLYMRRVNTSLWYLQAECDITKGMKDFGRGDYNGWDNGTNTGMTACAFSEGAYQSAPRAIETYKSETGHNSETYTIGFDGAGSGFKTAVVTNRVAYVGNVRIKNSVGDLITYGDAILKSDIGKFDSFSFDRRIEIEIRDGDEIVKLEEYADRLLVFKKKKMQLLNISQELEFLEETFMFKGVTNPAATCKTDYGIAWVNKIGCYLYDGEKVTNLLERKGAKLISDSDWNTFTNDPSTKEPMIGYLPKKRQLIVVDDITTNGDGSTFLYDIVTQSWVRGTIGTFPDQNKTNFVTDWNGDLVCAHDSGTIVKWNDTSYPSGSFDYRTKDIDFGQPGQKKKIYKVIVTYTTAASGNVASEVQVDYGVDGDTTFAYDFTVPELPAANGWQVTELVPDVSSEANNIKSIRLRFATDGTVPAGFEINDISIVYRLKPV